MFKGKRLSWTDKGVRKIISQISLSYEKTATTIIVKAIGITKPTSVCILRTNQALAIINANEKA
jgi:hypothetical protein